MLQCEDEMDASIRVHLLFTSALGTFFAKDRSAYTEIVLKILKPSTAVLMTAPGIWGCQ